MCSGMMSGCVFLYIMTYIERKKAELDKLYEYRAAAMRKNDLVWLSRNQQKIEEIEREIIEATRREPMKLSDVLKGHAPEVKNEVYKSLLRISVLADVVNNACEECKTVLGKFGLNDFSFRQDVDDMCKVSQKIASVVLIPNNEILEDFIVDNDEVVDGCTAIADKYLNNKLCL